MTAEKPFETEGFVTVNGVPTHVVTYGRWIEDDLADVDSMIFVLPGNPGLASYYKMFMSTLHIKTGGMPVWAVSHAGHKRPPSGLTFAECRRLYSLEDQIRHKLDFMSVYVPQRCRVYLVGHSIGCHLALEIMKRGGSKHRIQRSYMLCPTIEWIRRTPNGRKLSVPLKYFRWLLYFLATVASTLPESLKLVAVRWHFGSKSVSEDCLSSSVELIHWSVLSNVAYMAYTEFECVTRLDIDALRAYGDRFCFFYVAGDGWCPLEMHHQLVTAVPDVRSVVSEEGHDHAFVLQPSSSQEIGDMVARWICESRG